tara:strand:+ start:14627 stop:14887 length:261 start_codon:yes stop_codon:yes gene_type:complete
MEERMMAIIMIAKIIDLEEEFQDNMELGEALEVCDKALRLIGKSGLDTPMSWFLRDVIFAYETLLQKEKSIADKASKKIMEDLKNV